MESPLFLEEEVSASGSFSLDSELGQATQNTPSRGDAFLEDQPCQQGVRAGG